MGKFTTHEALGLKLTDKQLNELRDDQIGQLFELFQQIQKPSSSSEDDTQFHPQTSEDGTKSQVVDKGGTKSPLVDKDNTMLTDDNKSQDRKSQANEDSNKSHRVGS